MKNIKLFFSLFMLFFIAIGTADQVLQSTFRVDSNWGTGYIGYVTLTNTSNTEVTSWRTDFDLPTGEVLSSLWNGNYTASNSHITATNANWNGTIGAGQSISFGFQVDNTAAQGPAINNLKSIGSSGITTCSTCESFALTAAATIDSNWQTGYQATVTLTNTTDKPTASWSATFSLPQGQSVSDLWNGTAVKVNNTVTVTNLSWNAIIQAHSSTTFGFIVENPSGGPAQINDLKALANGTGPVTPPTSTVPAAPTLNAIVLNDATPNNYNVSWNSVQHATSYTLEESTNSNFSDAKVVAEGAILTKTFAGKANGTYYYRVFASNAAGKSSYSNTQSVTIKVQPASLSAPVLESINNDGASQYTLKWNSIQNATGYKLEESAKSDFSGASTIYSGPETSFQVSGKAQGTFYYRVSAFSANANSQPSNTVSVTVGSMNPPNPPPTQGKAIVESYWESWQSDPINSIVNMKVDDIDVSFVTFTSTGNHTFDVTGLDADQARLTEFITQAHNAGKKVKIAVGGATYGLAGMLLTKEDAEGMAKAIVAYVQKNKFDGVDYDIEDYPPAPLQVALLQHTRQLLGSNAILSYTPKAPASTTQPYAQLLQSGWQYLDGINIMAYDTYQGYKYQDDVKALIAMGIPASKILVGLMPGLDDLGVQTSLGDIQNASKFVVENGLGGIMFWSLNRDLTNQTGLGASAATNAAWPIIHP